MSLLNEMLRELHRRHALPDEAATGVVAGVTVVGGTCSEPGQGLPWKRILLLVAAFAMTAAGYALAHNFKSAAIDSSAARQATAGDELEAATESVSASPRGAIAALETSMSPPVSLRMGTSLVSASLSGLEETRSPLDVPLDSGESYEITAPARIADIRVVQSSREAVAVIELDRPVQFRAFMLADPARVVIDISQALGPIPHATVEGTGPVERVRMAPKTDEGLRMVLDLSRPVSIRHSSVEPDAEQAHLLKVELVSVLEEPTMAKTKEPAEVSPASSVAMAVQADPRSDENPASGTMQKKRVQVNRTDVAESRYREAMQLFAAGRDRAGEARLRKVLAVDPRHMMAREVLALQLFGQRRHREAFQVLLDGLKLQPGSSRLRNLYARLLVERGQPEEALAVLGKVSPPLAEDPEHHALRAALLQKTGQYRNAAELYRRLLVIRPKAGVWWMGLAIALESKGDHEQALEAYRKAAGQVDMTVTLNRFVKDRIEHIESKSS